VRDATGPACDLAAGCLTASGQPGIIAREGMNIDFAQGELYSPKRCLSLFFTNDPARAQVAQAQWGD
jgi:hypothetical protein